MELRGSVIAWWEVHTIAGPGEGFYNHLEKKFASIEAAEEAAVGEVSNWVRKDWRQVKLVAYELKMKVIRDGEQIKEAYEKRKAKEAKAAERAARPKRVRRTYKARKSRADVATEG